MAEGGEDYHSSPDEDSDVSLFDSDDDDDNVVDDGRGLSCKSNFA